MCHWTQVLSAGETSSGETRDWEQLDVHLSHQGVQNLLYLNDEDEEEEEEEGEEVEQQGRKVTVSENLLLPGTFFGHLGAALESSC